MREGEASRTAGYMALFRALEHVRPASARRISDPFARAFVDSRLRAVVTLGALPGVGELVRGYIDRRWPGARTSAVARTRFIDERSEAAITSGIEQIVLLGAGFDSRPYRLHGVGPDHGLRGGPPGHAGPEATTPRHRSLAGSFRARRLRPGSGRSRVARRRLRPRPHDALHLGRRDELPHRGRRRRHPALVRARRPVQPDRLHVRASRASSTIRPASSGPPACSRPSMRARSDGPSGWIPPGSRASSRRAAFTSTRTSAPRSIAGAAMERRRRRCEATSSIASRVRTSRRADTRRRGSRRHLQRERGNRARARRGCCAGSPTCRRKIDAAR